MLNSTQALSRRWLICIVIAAASAFVLKTTLAWNTYGTNDVLFWEANLAKIRADGGLALYRDGAPMFQHGSLIRIEHFNQPPFIIHVLRLWGCAEEVSGLPLRFWLRLTSALADIGSLIVIWQIVKQTPALKLRPVMLLLFAVCPLSVLVSGFHGNTDPIMMFLVLLAIYAVETHKSPFLAGALLGFAASIKIVPIIFVPVVFLYLSRVKDRVSFFIAFCSIAFLSGLPYVLLSPILIIGKVARYNSDSGNWGFSLITDFYAHGKVALIICLILVYAGIWISKLRSMLFAQCGLITSLFLFLAPGFGGQYLTWLVPWVLYLTPAVAAGYYLVGGVFLFVVYTYWSGGFPWYLANSLQVQGWSLWGSFFGLACWQVTGILFVLFASSLLKQVRTIPSYGSPATSGTR